MVGAGGADRQQTSPLSVCPAAERERLEREAGKLFYRLDQIITRNRQDPGRLMKEAALEKQNFTRRLRAASAAVRQQVCSASCGESVCPSVCPPGGGGRSSCISRSRPAPNTAPWGGAPRNVGGWDGSPGGVSLMGSPPQTGRPEPFDLSECDSCERLQARCRDQRVCAGAAVILAMGLSLLGLVLGAAVGAFLCYRRRARPAGGTGAEEGPAAARTEPPAEQRDGAPVDLENGAPAEQGDGAPADLENGAPAEQRDGAPADLENGASAEQRDRAPADLENGAPAEQRDGAPADLENGAPAEQRDRAPADLENGAPAEQGDGAPTDLENGAPAEQRDGAPADLGNGAPAEQRDGAPADLGNGAPAEQQDGAPADLGNGAPAEQGDRAPADLGNGAPAEQGTGATTH
ncbi:resuscitation-promoting factor RpfA-like isoform X1 [Gopherus evgoodei]|uniref:resuscitation-promoting factor RpfA-like isoform X1 n=2 Tax=Gopherus evgoodei TaxID=1825980 RepID=UPI0011CF45C1|nr:resuscitation-promoting factor RpfA-like isoform X1 [Gopherus evgoodei]